MAASGFSAFGYGLHDTAVATACDADAEACEQLAEAERLREIGVLAADC